MKTGNTIHLPLHLRRVADLNDPNQLSCRLVNAIADCDGKVLAVEGKDGSFIIPNVIRLVNDAYFGGWVSNKNKNTVFYTFVDAEPMSKPKQGTIYGVGQDNTVVDPPNYRAYVSYLAKKITDNASARNITLPINEPVRLSAVFYVSDYRAGELSELLSPLIQALYTAGVIRKKAKSYIESTDGSKIVKDAGNPRIELIISTEGDK